MDFILQLMHGNSPVLTLLIICIIYVVIALHRITIRLTRIETILGTRGLGQPRGRQSGV